MVTELTDCHASDPPLMVGSTGAVRSMRTVSVESGVPGAHAETFPARSTDRN